MSLKNIDDELIDFMAKTMIEQAKGNKNNQPNYEQDEDFGLVPHKPIYTLFMNLIDGEEEYLDSLFTSNGDKINWERTGSISPAGISGVVDIYNTYLPSGEFYKKIYINMYGTEESINAPKGFERIASVKSQIKTTNRFKTDNTSKICHICGKTNPDDSEFCQFCGVKIVAIAHTTPPNIDVVNKHETKNGNSDKTSNIFNKAVIIICFALSFILAFCLIEMNSLKTEISSLNSTVKSYKQKYADAYQESTDYKNKYTKITNFLKSYDAGYASSNYYASDNIVVLNKYGSTKNVTITCKYYNTTVYCHNPDNSVVLTSWSMNWNGYNTSISFLPLREGTSILEFTNSKNDESFRIMVIVV